MNSNNEKTRRALLDTLAECGFGGEQLAAMGKVVDVERSDVFDVLADLAFTKSPRTRAERRRASILPRYDARLQSFIGFVLDPYVVQGVDELDGDKLSRLLELRYQTLADAMAELGTAPVVRAAFVDVQRHLHAPH